MSSDRISVLHAVTDSISTVLMRGQLAYLKANGFETSLLSSPGEKLEQVGAQEGCSVFGVAMTREISPISDLKSLFGIWRLLRQLHPVICNSGTPKAGLLVGLAAWLARVPCRVYTLRGLRLETASGIRRMILMTAEKVACFCAHRVVCVSPSLRERAVALGIVARSKTVLLGTGSSNGVDPSRFEPASESTASSMDLRRSLGMRPDQPVIGFVGRLTRDKGLPELVTAFQSMRRKLPEAVLLLIGDYEHGDPVPDNIRNVIESEPSIHHVAFTSQVERYYHVMNVFALPTHREGFPNTVLEAQAAGLPVITTVATGAIDAIEDGKTGLLTPVGDADTLAAAMLLLLSDPGKIQSMGRAGRERVLQKFRSETVWDALAAMYRTMLQERGYSLPSHSRVEVARCAHSQ